MSARNTHYRDLDLNRNFNHRSVLNDTGMYDAASEAMDAISQEASYDSTNPGLLNDLFGAALYVQSNLEANFFGALPKMDMTGSNTSATQPLPLTFRAAYGPPALQTHSEGGPIPDGRTYEIEEVSADIKRSLAVIEQSDLEQLRAELLDGVPLDELTRVDELYQDLAIDRDAIAKGVSADNAGYAERDEVTELDRVVASGDEEANADDVSGTAFTDGDLDVYDLDRSTDSWADAFVDFAAAADPDRQLTEALMDDFLSNLFDFGDLSREDAVILTGRKTGGVLDEIDEDTTVVNFDADDAGRESVNDAQTRRGIPGTTRRRHYKGVPIVENQNAPTHGAIPSIYVIPTDTIGIGGGVQVPRLGIEEYAAPYVETAGRGQDQGFLSLGSFENKTLFKMDHELVCRDFSATGKLRDITQ